MVNNVVVIGGGYAGVMAANRLTKRGDVAVTVINARADFVERIRLHQLVGGSEDAVADYRDVLADSARLVVDTATRIDAAARRVELASGAALDYDYLVYAVGSVAAEPTVPGAAEFAFPLAAFEDARRLREALGAAGPAAPVTVVGGGATGIETAAELAETGRPVTLVCGGALGPYLHPRGRRAVARALARLGVTVLADAEVTEVRPLEVVLRDGRGLPSGVTVWTAGFRVPGLARRSGLSVDAAGRAMTDETLTSVDDERIVAAGDAAAPAGTALRMSCQAAMPLGVRAAETVLARIAGEQPAPVDAGFVGMCLSLGRGRGVFQVAHRDDSARGLYLGGVPGAKLKEYVCRSVFGALVKEADKPGSFWWPKYAGQALPAQAQSREALV